MPIANDIETKNVQHIMYGDVLTEAFLSQSPASIHSPSPQSVHSSIPTTRSHTSLSSMGDNQNNFLNCHNAAKDDIVYKLTSMLDPTTCYYSKPLSQDTSCQQNNHPLNEHHQPGEFNPNVISGMKSEFGDAQSSQTSFDLRSTETFAGNFATDLECEQNMGFSGQSNSSCHTNSLEQEIPSGSSWSSLPIDWSESETDTCLHGKNKIDDLIYHFEQFFRGQIDKKLNEVENFVYSFLNEQKTHLRHIVNTAVKSTQMSSSPQKEHGLSSPARKITRLSNSEQVHGMQMVNTSNLADIKTGAQSAKGEDKLKHIDDDKTKMLLKILTMSCAVGGMLLRPEYHT